MKKKNRTPPLRRRRSRPLRRLGWSAAAGLAAVAVLTAFAATAPPTASGQKLQPFALAEGSLATWAAVTVVVFIAATVAAARRARRVSRQAGAGATRRGRRAAARGW
ncbi:MAG: hypothetical protein ACRDOH_36020 [Streptosporangiaceae bacterium]